MIDFFLTNICRIIYIPPKLSGATNHLFPYENQRLNGTFRLVIVCVMEFAVITAFFITLLALFCVFEEQ